jgi:RNA polymerase sigma factor (sigma-70 family)
VTHQADSVRAAISGDTQAFGQLITTHTPMVCAITLSMTGNRQASEDAAQDALLAAWDNLPTLADPERFSAWLRQLTKNRTKQFLRSRSRRLARVAPDSATVESATCEAPNAPDDLMAAERDAAVVAAIAELPEGSREVVILFYRQEQSVAQVAKALDLTEPAVRKRLNRARNALRGDLDERVGPLLALTAPVPDFFAWVEGAVTPRMPRTVHPGNRQAWMASGGVVGAALTAALLLWVLPLSTAVVSADPVEAESPPARAVAPSHREVRLLRPTTEEEVAPITRPQPALQYADLTPFQKVEQSQLVNGFWRASYAACFAPGLELDRPVEVEIRTTVDSKGLQSVAFDAVDGVSEELVACLDDLAWSLPWPGIDGELEQSHIYTLEEIPEPVSWEQGHEDAQRAIEGMTRVLAALAKDRDLLEAEWTYAEEHPDAEVVLFEGGAE